MVSFLVCAFILVAIAYFSLLCFGETALWLYKKIEDVFALRSQVESRLAPMQSQTSRKVTNHR
jgi:hypothetical protein